MEDMGKIYLLTDTHFDHYEMVTKFKKRKQGFEDKIWKGLKTLNEDDILIHLGDFCIGNDKSNAEKFNKICKCKTKILVKGNHDKKSDKWYIENAGFNIVVYSLLEKINGKYIYFTHMPSSDKIGDYNIHGHTHGNGYEHDKNIYREKVDTFFTIGNYIKDYHIEYALENEGYSPLSLTGFLKKKKII